MTLPLIVLAVGAVFAGFLGVPEGLSGGKIPNYFERFLEPSIARVGAAHATEQATGEHTTAPARSEATASRVEASEPAPATENQGLELRLMAFSVLFAFVGLAI